MYAENFMDAYKNIYKDKDYSNIPTTLKSKNDSSASGSGTSNMSSKYSKGLFDDEEINFNDVVGEKSNNEVNKDMIEKFGKQLEKEITD